MKKNKLAAFVLAALINSSVLCGCGEQGNDKLLDPENPVTVTIWHYYNGVQQTTFDEMVKEFNETVGLDKGIIVEAFSKSSINELADSVLAAVNKDAGADLPPDIFATYPETAYKLDKLGAVADLKPYLTEEEIAEYIPEYIEEGEISENAIKIFPTAKSTEIMMLNKTDWDKFSEATGVTVDELETVEGVTAIAEKYYSYTDGLTPDIPDDGKAFFGRDSAANYMFNGAKQLGNEYVTINSDGQAVVNLDKDVIKKLWENYYVPHVKGYFASQSRFRSDDAKTGIIISLVCSTSGAAYFPDEVTVGDDYTYPIESMIISVPYFEGTNPYMVQQGAGMSVIKSDSANEYAGIVFLKWFTEAERNIKFSIGSGYLPVKSDANDYSKIVAVNDTLEYPMGSMMLNTIETAINDINERDLYISAPFNKSAEARDCIGNYMQDTASADRAAVCERLAAGEDRESVLADYIGEAAFDKWYEGFEAGLADVIG